MGVKRSSGVLLHPTSFPSPFGIGDLGPYTRKWVDFLTETGTGLWQVLPLGPTGYGDSPYQCFSSFAGNPYLVSPELLLQEGLIHSNDLDKIPDDLLEIGSSQTSISTFSKLHRPDIKKRVLRFLPQPSGLVKQLCFVHGNKGGPCRSNLD